ARLFSVFGVNRVCYFHSLNHSGNRRKRLLIVRGRVIAQIDEYLRRASVGIFESEGHRAAHVRQHAWIVSDVTSSPHCGHLRIPVDPELRPQSGAYAKDGCVVVVTVTLVIDDTAATE